MTSFTQIDGTLAPDVIEALAVLLTDTDDMAGVMQIYALEVIARVSQSSAVNAIVHCLFEPPVDCLKLLLSKPRLRPRVRFDLSTDVNSLWQHTPLARMPHLA